MISAGLTGNFGMGKSSVLAVFRALGAATLDSDAVVARLLKDEKIVRRIKKILGADVVGDDGALEKKKIAEKIFRDPTARKALESLLHPMVIRTIKKRLGVLADMRKVVVVEVPLLFESRYESAFDKTITVFTTKVNAFARLRAKGVPAKEAAARISTQLDIRTKKKRADFLIDNNGTQAATRKQVGRIYRCLQELDAGKDRATT